MGKTVESFHALDLGSLHAGGDCVASQASAVQDFCHQDSADGSTAASHESLMESFGLTKSEGEVTLLIYNGASRVSVAAARDIALDTVKTHLARIFRKLEVDSQQRIIRKVSDLVRGSS
jgi:DNA-binding CsgD family transcriptional regulator